MKRLIAETSRLLIREFSEDDLEGFASLVSNPLVMEFSEKGAPLSKSEAQLYLKTRILDHYQKYGYGLWALIEKKSEHLIGFAGLIEQKILGEVHSELAYRLHPDYWNRGLAFEACKGILEYSKKQLHKTELISLISSDNTPSVKLSKKLDFVEWKKTEYKGDKVFIYKRSLLQ